MKTINILFLMLPFLLTLNTFYSQSQNNLLDPDAVKYLPLKVGNVWTYKWEDHRPYFPTDTGKIKITINKDTVINSKRYFSFVSNSVSHYGPLSPFVQKWIRFDSTTGNLIGYNTESNCPRYPYEIVIDSLSSWKGDTLKACINQHRTCIDTGSYNLLNVQTSKKNFFGNSLSDGRIFYAKNLGIYFSSYGEQQWTDYYLKGCVINGVVYGDTLLLGLQPVSTIVPEKYALFQNYPNPFNPSTKIKFDLGPPLNPLLRKEGMVTFVIYDVLGKEITTLVNEQLKPGTYEVEWNASDYPSGIYFYILQTESFTKTKKMVLVK